jgi:hypothetical protein
MIKKLAIAYIFLTRVLPITLVAVATVWIWGPIILWEKLDSYLAEKADWRP